MDRTKLSPDSIATNKSDDLLYVSWKRGWGVSALGQATFGRADLYFQSPKKHRESKYGLVSSKAIFNQIPEGSIEPTPHSLACPMTEIRVESVGVRLSLCSGLSNTTFGDYDPM